MYAKRYRQQQQSPHLLNPYKEMSPTKCKIWNTINNSSSTSIKNPNLLLWITMHRNRIKWNSSGLWQLTEYVSRIHFTTNWIHSFNIQKTSYLSPIVCKQQWSNRFWDLCIWRSGPSKCCKVFFPWCFMTCAKLFASVTHIYWMRIFFRKWQMGRMILIFQNGTSVNDEWCKYDGTKKKKTQYSISK